MSFYPYLVADIGGTNARFGLVYKTTSPKTHIEIKDKITLPSDKFENLDSAIAHYLKNVDCNQIKSACVAVAAPVYADRVNLTNLNWTFSVKQVKQQLKLTHFKVINDFTAQALAIPMIDTSSSLNIKPGILLSNAPQAVVGPGTGFGAACLIPTEQGRTALATEAGHIPIPCNNDLQREIVSFLNLELEHVSIETVLSGTGVSNLYRALASVSGAQTKSIGTREICNQAMLDQSSLAHQTLSLYCYWLGQITSYLTLMLGANGGVYLAGGFLLRIKEHLVNSDFGLGFMDNNQMSEFLKNIAVNLLLEDSSALLGAAYYFERELRTINRSIFKASK